METFAVAQIFDINDVNESYSESWDDSDYIKIEVYSLLGLEELAELKERFNFGLSYLFGNFDDAKFALAAIKTNTIYWCKDEDGNIAAFGTTKSKALIALADWFSTQEKNEKS